MQTDHIVTRLATEQDIGVLLAWAASEGWNPGIDDKSLFQAVDHAGFYITVLNNEPVAGMSLVTLGDEQAFLGLYICKPEYRGRGYGIDTWNFAINATENKTIGLDGVVEQQANYATSGFEFVHRNVRYSGVMDFTGSQGESSARPAKSEITHRKANHDDLASIVEFDASIGGFARHDFYRAWLQPCDSRITMVAMQGYSLVGLFGIRRCVEGFKIGPLLANEDHIAVALLREAKKVCLNEQVMIDVPEPNSSAVSLLQQLSLEPVFETARMYRGPAPDIDTNRLYGVATLELG